MKIKASTSNFLRKSYWWFKATLLVVAISTITYGIGTFTPNPLAVKKATEEVRIEHAEWAEKLGLNEPSFEYTNSKEFIIEHGEYEKHGKSSKYKEEGSGMKMHSEKSAKRKEEGSGSR